MRQLALRAMITIIFLSWPRLPASGQSAWWLLLSNRQIEHERTTSSSKGAGSQSIYSELCNNNLSKARSATASGLFIGASEKLLRCVFLPWVPCILPYMYFKCVFGHGFAVFVLVNSWPADLPNFCGPYIYITDLQSLVQRFLDTYKQGIFFSQKGQAWPWCSKTPWVPTSM